MYPEQLVVEPGGSKLINCSTSCAQPQTGGLETALTKTLLESGARWKQYLVSNISRDTVIHCYFTCLGNQKLKSLNVSVFCECHPAGPSSPGPSPCLLTVCRATLVPLLGTRFGPHLPGLLGARGAGPRPWAQSLLTPFTGLREPAGHAASEACSEDSPSKVCAN